MTTHPPGQPPGPTHPPKTTTFPVVSTAHAELDYPEPADYGVEPDSAPVPAGPLLDEADWVAADFYEPGKTYVSAEFPQYDWRFRCDHITAHPEDGERTALGWRYWRGHWEAYAYGECDWSIDRLRVASAAETTPAKGEEPTPGSAAALGTAARESTGAVVAPGAGASPDPSSAGVAPVAPGRGVGPKFFGSPRTRRSAAQMVTGTKACVDRDCPHFGTWHVHSLTG